MLLLGRNAFDVIPEVLDGSGSRIGGTHTFASRAHACSPLWCLGRTCGVSLSRLMRVLSWCAFQGPRGLPGERGRTGPAGAAVSNDKAETHHLAGPLEITRHFHIGLFCLTLKTTP